MKNILLNKCMLKSRRFHLKTFLLLIIAIALFSSYNINPFINTIDRIMKKPPKILMQYILPQHLLTYIAGELGKSRKPWLKDFLIQTFINHFKVNMHEAVIEDPKAYASFNDFFTRAIKPERRPIVSGAGEIASPVDGTISQLGDIHADTIFQAKGYDYSAKTLLGGSEERAKLFENGRFITFYLSPKDYHRVHMPMTGKLRQTIYIPGDLFSVNQKTTKNVPQLFTRNERLVALFDTEAGPMAVVMVAAMLVGNIQTVWHAKNKAQDVLVESYGGSFTLQRGDEMGHFEMGSTVIVLLGKNSAEWNGALKANSAVKLGELIATRK